MASTMQNQEKKENEKPSTLRKSKAPFKIKENMLPTRRWSKDFTDKVKLMRKMFYEKKSTYFQLAKEFNMTEFEIVDVICRYKHIMKAEYKKSISREQLIVQPIL